MTQKQKCLGCGKYKPLDRAHFKMQRGKFVSRCKGCWALMVAQDILDNSIGECLGSIERWRDTERVDPDLKLCYCRT
jgi:hypothetical protein